MQTHFKGTNYELTEEIQNFTLKKLSAISKFVGKELETEAQVFVELGRETGAHTQGKVWRAEFNFDQGSKRLRAQATEELLEDAIDEAIKDLSRELRSDKSRRESLGKRGGLVLKSMLRGFQP